jgi:hypothetical protein
MQKKIWVTYHKVGETTQFFGSKKQSNIEQFIHRFEKIENIKFGPIEIHAPF